MSFPCMAIIAALYWGCPWFGAHVAYHRRGSLPIRATALDEHKVICGPEERHTLVLDWLGFKLELSRELPSFDDTPPAP